MSEEKLKQRNIKPLARIVSFGEVEVEPIDFTISPIKSSKLSLKRAGLKIQDIDYFEVNEAFAVTALTYMKLLNIDISKVNIYGGAVAIGHPLGYVNAIRNYQ